MYTYLQPADDELPMRLSGPWAAEKLDYLKRYINIFETSMRNKPWRARNYIDLFAGPGKCLVERTGAVYLGSPLLALTTEHPFTDYYFSDIQPENIETLTRRCSVSVQKDHIRYYSGDSNVQVREIVNEILTVDSIYKPGVWSSLNLAFLDPAGLDLAWDTVATLAQPYSMDLIIFYPQNALTRNIERLVASDAPNKADRFFGDRDWRSVYLRHRGKNIGYVHRELMDYYKKRLVELDYSEVLRDDETGDEPLMRNAKKNAPLYRLLFASKHPLGNKFWHDVTRRDVHGQLRLLDS